MPEKNFDKSLDLHPSEWKVGGKRRLPFTWFDVQIWAVYLIVGLIAHWFFSAVVDWLLPSTPPWAQ